MTLSIANFSSVSDDRNNSEWYSSSNSKERWTSPIFWFRNFYLCIFSKEYPIGSQLDNKNFSNLSDKKEIKYL